MLLTEADQRPEPWLLAIRSEWGRHRLHRPLALMKSKNGSEFDCRAAETAGLPPSGDDTGIVHGPRSRSRCKLS